MRLLLEAGDWLVNSGGLWKAVIGAVVALAIAHVWTWRPRRTLRKIHALLDTGKPGGLTDVVDAINQKRGTLEP